MRRHCAIRRHRHRRIHDERGDHRGASVAAPAPDAPQAPSSSGYSAAAGASRPRLASAHTTYVQHADGISHRAHVRSPFAPSSLRRCSLPLGAGNRTGGHGDCLSRRRSPPRAAGCHQAPHAGAGRDYIGGERFLTEIRVTAHLQHPHILGLIDSGEADGLLNYVMPFVEGESLRARLERERQLPVSEALRVTQKVGSVRPPSRRDSSRYQAGESQGRLEPVLVSAFMQRCADSRDDRGGSVHRSVASASRSA